jgi:hypothetical protein
MRTKGGLEHLPVGPVAETGLGAAAIAGFLAAPRLGRKVFTFF